MLASPLAPLESVLKLWLEVLKEVEIIYLMKACNGNVCLVLELRDALFWRKRIDYFRGDVRGRHGFPVRDCWKLVFPSLGDGWRLVRCHFWRFLCVIGTSVAGVAARPPSLKNWAELGGST